MARKKKITNIFLILLIASILVLGYITKQGYENFTNSEKFESFREKGSCGTCKVGGGH